MNEVLESEIARLVDSGFELIAVTPDGRAELQREGELVRLRLQGDYVTAQHGLRVAPPEEPPEPVPPEGRIIRSRPGRVAVFGELRTDDLRARVEPQRRGPGIGKLLTAVVLLALIAGAFVFSRAAMDGDASWAASPPGASQIAPGETAPTADADDTPATL